MLFRPRRTGGAIYRRASLWSGLFCLRVRLRLVGILGVVSSAHPLRALGARAAPGLMPPARSGFPPDRPDGTRRTAGVKWLRGRSSPAEIRGLPSRAACSAYPTVAGGSVFVERTVPRQEHGRHARQFDHAKRRRPSETSIRTGALPCPRQEVPQTSVVAFRGGTD